MGALGGGEYSEASRRRVIGEMSLYIELAHQGRIVVKETERRRVKLEAIRIATPSGKWRRAAWRGF